MIVKMKITVFELSQNLLGYTVVVFSTLLIKQFMNAFSFTKMFKAFTNLRDM